MRRAGSGEWRDMTIALPARIDGALRDAALELEPKTQTVAIPRRPIRSEADLDGWLARNPGDDRSTARRRPRVAERLT